MSNVRLNCPHCTKIVEAPSELAGSVVSCPHCRGAFDLQLPANPPDTAPAQAQPSGATEIVLCPSCQKQLQIPVELAGHAVRCPLCNNQFTLPSKIVPSEPVAPIPVKETKTPTPKPIRRTQKVRTNAIADEPQPEMPLEEVVVTEPPPEPEKKTSKLAIIIPVVAAVVAILAVVVYFATRSKGGESGSDSLPDDQLFTQVVRDYPGWVGTAKLDDGTTILAASADDASPMYTKLNAHRELAVSMVVFRAKPASAPCTIDPASATFSVGDLKVKGLAHADVINSMQKQTPWIQYLRGPITFQPGKVGDCGMIFYLNCLKDFDLKKTSAINLTVNGNTVAIPGSYMTAEEKKANIKVGNSGK